MNKSLKFWSNWLLLVVDFTLLFGLLMIFSPSFFRDTFYRLYTDFYYGRGGAFEALPAMDITLQLWFYGLAGAIMLGWAVLMGVVIYIPFRRGEKWAWLALAGCLAVWFIFDGFASVVYGMSINVLLNIGFAILFVVPLVATHRIFFGAENPKQVLATSA